MTREERLKLCKVYKGGAEKYDYRNGNDNLINLCERHWVEQCGPDSTEHLKQTIKEYDVYGLSNFNANDGVPKELKAILFNRFCHHLDCVDVNLFKEFYNEYYKKR